ncbi:MAG: tetratricopeptide repeat protein [Candidatus Aadella gelida]|nr:tetratricopeptide repeat protein [Candidatus Aadella gelida]
MSVKVKISLLTFVLVALVNILAYAEPNEVERLDITSLDSKSGEAKKIMASAGFEEYVNGNEYFLKREYDKAIIEYKKAIGKDPKFAYATNNLASIYKELKKYDEAVMYYNETLDIDSNFFGALNGLGYVYIEKSKYLEAEQLINKALKLDPSPFAEYYNLGVLYQRQKKFDKAIENYEESIKINPKVYQAYIGIGDSYGDSGNYDKAIESYNEYLRYFPKADEICTRVGVCYVFKKDYDDAVVYFEKAVKINPRNNLAKTALKKYRKLAGNTYVGAKDNFLNQVTEEEAIKIEKTFKKKIAETPDDLRGYQALGMLYEKTGQESKALDAYAKYFGGTLDSAKGYDFLGQFYSRNKKTDKAIECFEKAIELEPNNADFISNLAGPYLEMGQYGKAIELYKMAIKINSNKVNFQLRLANAYLLDGEKDKAITECKNILKKYPRQKQAEAMLNYLNKGGEEVKKNLSIVGDKLVLKDLNLIIEKPEGWYFYPYSNSRIAAIISSSEDPSESDPIFTFALKKIKGRNIEAINAEYAKNAALTMKNKKVIRLGDTEKHKIAGEDAYEDMYVFNVKGISKTFVVTSFEKDNIAYSLYYLGDYEKSGKEFKIYREMFDKINFIK